MGFLRLLTLTIILIFTLQSAAAGWYNDNWLYRKEITIDHTRVSADQTNFSLLIDINDPDIRSKAKSNGSDILFTDSSGNKLNHEIEIYDPITGHLIAWVNAPFLSNLTNTSIYVYYGNGIASNQENPEAVWDSNYLAVYHLNETTGDDLDSTSNNNDGTPKGNMNQDVTGKIDGGDSFDGKDDNITLPKIYHSETQFTIETWLNISTQRGYAVSQWINYNGTFIQYYALEGTVQFWVNNRQINKSIPKNKWVHVVGTFDGTTAFLYVNGGTPVSINASLIWPDSSTYIGDRSTFDRQFLGKLDEIRFSNTSRSSDYVQTTYNNQNDPGNFYGVGAEEIKTIPISLKSITVSPPTASLTVSGTQMFNATAMDQNNNPMAGVILSWASNDTAVGDVVPATAITNADGNAYTTFNATGEGVAMVTVTNSTVIGSANVTVTPAPVPELTTITVSPPTASLTVSGTQMFNATAMDKNNNPMAGIILTWASNDTAVGDVVPSTATTDAFGNASTTFMANTSGTARIIAANDTVEGSADIIINAASGWYNDNWLYRKEITIDHTRVSADQTNFSLLIDINDPDIQSKAQSNGSDILFTDSSGGNKLNHEIETYDPTIGHLIVWVNAPFLSNLTNTSIYVYYGNGIASNQENPEAVWDSNYLAVYHLNETTGDVLDSTSNNNDGTPKGNMNQDVTGKIDGGDSFDGKDDNITLPKIYHSETQFTIETWLNISNQRGYVVSQYVNNNGTFIQYYAQDNAVQFWVNNIKITKSIPRNQWVQVVGTFDGTKALLYVNGGTPVSINANLVWPDTSYTYIGDRSTFDRQFLGKLDEIRFSNTSRSSDYVQTTYNNQNDPGNFYRVGTEETNTIPRSLKSITVSPQTVSLMVGGKQIFNATALDQYGTPMNGLNITWTNSNATVGSIVPFFAITDENGNASTTFNALMLGNTVIYATNGTKTGTVTITVNPNTLPLISNETPINGSTNISLNPKLSVDVKDPENDLLNITFSYYNGSNWVILQTYKNQPSGTYVADTYGYMTKPHTSYKWKVVVTDSRETIEKIFNLKTGNILKFKWKANVGPGQILPLMADIDKDGNQELIMSAGSSIRVLNGKTGALKYKAYQSSNTAIELVDLDDDGTPEILHGVADPNNRGRRLRALNGTGAVNGILQERWTSLPVKGEDEPLFPIIGYDIDGDGYPTLYFATSDIYPENFSGNMSDYTGRITMLDHKGKILAETWVYRPCWGGMSLGDVDFDGQFELYIGDRGTDFYSVPGKGLQAFNAHNLTELWNYSNIVTSSTMPILANVTDNENLEVLGVYVRNRGVAVFNATTGTIIYNNLSNRLNTHATGTVYDIDEDGRLELFSSDGQTNESLKNFTVFDLVAGKTDNRTTLTYNAAWPPTVGDVDGDGHMEILVGLGLENDKNTDYPLLIYDKNYNLIETVNITGAGQLTPPRIYDIDNDGYNELVIGGYNGTLWAYDTQARTPTPAPRTWSQWYSEYRQGAPVYITPPGPKQPVIKSETPADKTENISLNPTLSVMVYDYQKDNFNVTFEIFNDTNWEAIAIYNNMSVRKFTNFSADTSGYQHNKQYQWRVKVEDNKGNSGNKTFSFTTSP